MLLSELVDEFVRHKKKEGLTGGTILRIENSARILQRSNLWNRKIREIRKVDIEDFLIDFGEGHAKSYVANQQTNLSSIFNYALDQDYILKNPCVRVKLPNNTNNGRDNIDSFTKEEVAALESHRGESVIADVVYIMLNTGLRTQEVCAVDRKSRVIKNGKPYIRVNKAMKKAGLGKWEVGEPKTSCSVRDIPVTDEVDKTMLKLFMRSGNLLIAKSNGDYVSYTSFIKRYKKYIESLNKAGENIRELPPHCCRHTFASRCEWSDIPPMIRMELLGHTSIGMTSHYTHIMDEDKEAAVRRIL